MSDTDTAGSVVGGRDKKSSSHPEVSEQEGHDPGIHVEFINSFIPQVADLSWLLL